MKKSTPQLLVFLTVLLFTIAPAKKAKASHSAGGEIIYEWICDSTYRFYFKFYRDCTGSAAPNQVTMCAWNPVTSQTTNVILSRLTNCPNCPGIGNQLSPGCDNTPTRCDDPQSAVPGYQEWWYTTTWTIPNRGNAWRFGVSINLRNQSFNYAGVPQFYIETTFNNTNTYQGPCTGTQRGNSSPYFSVKPIPYVCINQPYTYNNGAVDPDGDSLVTEVINPLINTSCGAPPQPVALAQQGAPLTPTLNIPNNPFQTGNTFTVNAQTGQVNFTPLGPAATQVNPRGHTLTMRTLEYRNGVLIGSIMRDIQVQVLTCTSPPPTFNGVNPTITGAVWNNTLQRVEACVDQQFNFCFNATSPDPDALIKMTDNASTISPNASVTYSNQLTDNVTGCFNWKPGLNESGLKVLNITVIDSTCNPPGILLAQTYTIPIYVWPATETLKDTSVCPLEAVDLLATGGGNFQWSVIPGGSPLSSMSCTACPDPRVRPALTTQYIATSTINSYCKHIKDTVTISVKPTPDIDAGPDTVTCINNSVQMNVNVIQQPGLTYKIKWTPSTGLNDDTLFNPIASPKQDITYYIVVTPSDVNACKAYDTVKVDVLQGYNLLNNDTAICDGQSVAVNLTGDQRYNFLWSPPSGVSDPNSSNPTITPTGPVDTIKYTVTASRVGCADSVRDFTIQVQPNPTVNVTTPATLLCYGDTLTLDADVTPEFPYTYNWTPGSTLTDPASLNSVFTAFATTTLTLTATTSAGCSGDDDVTISVNPSKFLEVSPDTAICPGDTVQLRMAATGTTVLSSFSWSPSENNMSDPTSIAPYIWPYTSSTYTVIGIDDNKCQDTQSVKILVRPQANLSLPDSVRLFPGESYQMNPEGNCLYFTWFPPLGLDDSKGSNPKAKPEVNTRYIVQGVTEGGCVATDSIEVLVQPDSYIDVPNAFTPGSRPNAVLKVVHKGIASLKNFTIYNRWGTKVFETSDINAGWDGRFNGEPQPIGVYVYMVEGQTATGRRITKQGNVTLIR